MVTTRGTRLSIRCADAIRRYQAFATRRRAQGACRFDPSCSNYALQAFEERAFLVALGMTASRLLRCNPLVRRATSDPVRRPRRTPRPGTVRSLLLLSGLSGLILLASLGGTASADPPTGGCTGSANGRPAASITRDHPLKVKEHDTVAAEGSTPPGKSGRNLTHVEIFLIDPIGGVTTEDHVGSGSTWSSSTVEIDDYLKYGVGTYKVEITNVGPGWKCTFVGYVELEGNPLTKPIGIAAAGATAVGAAGSLLSPRRKPTPRWADEQIRNARPTRDVMDTIIEEGDKVVQAADAARGPSLEEEIFIAAVKDPVVRFCLPCLISMLLVPMWAAVGTGGGALVVRPMPTGPVHWKRRIWRRGRPIAGFVSGLLFGLGVTVLLWQYDVWLLDILTAIVFPVVLGVLFGAYAWRGKPYNLVAVPREGAPPPPAVGEEPPPPPPPVEEEPPPPPPAV